MLTQTSEMAIRALLFMLSNRQQQILTPKSIAEEINVSPTYLVKTLRLLVKAGILRSHRGAHGGVELLREPEAVTLLDIVEACQGLIVGNYCSALGRDEMNEACAFHLAMQDVYDATVGALSRWNLADLALRPAPVGSHLDPTRCKMVFGCHGIHKEQSKVEEAMEGLNNE